MDFHFCPRIRKVALHSLLDISEIGEEFVIQIPIHRAIQYLIDGEGIFVHMESISTNL